MVRISLCGSELSSMAELQKKTIVELSPFLRCHIKGNGHLGGRFESTKLAAGDYILLDAAINGMLDSG